MTNQDCRDIHCWLVTVIRQQPARADIDEVLEMLGQLDQAAKLYLWRWLSQHDPNLQKWLKFQGQQREVA